MRSPFGHLGLARRVILAATIAAFVSAASLVASPGKAFADTGGYPDDGALCMSTGVRGGSCGGYNWGYKQSNGSWTLNSRRGYGYRNCTDFVAWKLNVTSGLGNAIDWKANAAKAGRVSTNTPSVGDVAWWGTSAGQYGHVAAVTAVAADNSVTVEEYNHDTLGNWDTRSGLQAETYLHNPNNQGVGGGTAPGPRRNTSNVNADGNDDMMLLTRDPGDSTGANIGWSTNAGFWMQPEWWNDRYTDFAAMKPMVGDVTGDGRADLVYLVPIPNGSAAYVLAANSNGNGFVQPATRWWDGTNYQFNAIKPALGDVNADGKEDLVLAFNINGTTISMALSNGTGFALQPSWFSDPYTDWSHFTMMVGDINGDGTADVSYLVPNSNGTAAYVLRSTNHSFVAAEKWWYGEGWGWSGIKTVMGDFDGNGYADMGLITSEPGGGTAFTAGLSTGNGFWVQTNWWRDPNTDWNVMKPFAGNFNGDTFNNGSVTSPVDDVGFLVPSASLGPRAFILPSHRSGLDAPTEWWHDAGYGFDSTKVAARN